MKCIDKVVIVSADSPSKLNDNINQEMKLLDHYFLTDIKLTTDEKFITAALCFNKR